ncbi:hypothetical protein [uncultured Duncaniella sp.]|uniref:hypothetical protein n=1 Tax=uncultured Duncaniella sp. TaxID=2768039 RepID=UPI002711F0E5|nr:hypothetical protein [uncultured Duncaniella sp.]
MQTIKVTTGKTEYGVAFAVQGGNFLAAVGTDFYNKGRYAGQFSPFASCNNKGFAEAVEFIGDAICNHFAQFGLNVEFVNA